MRRLTTVIQAYAWGSHSALAELEGRPVPTPGPEAELWAGAHPSAPSFVDSQRLDEAIAKQPAGLLGAQVVRRFGPRLPYLLKVLAAEQPLSLQAHPDLERAQARFAAGDPNYVDGNHKPELLVAVTEFDALCGFRPIADAAEVFAALDVPLLGPVVKALDGGDLRDAVSQLLTWPEEERREVIAAVVAASPDGSVVRSLAARYPEDMGVLVALLLNHVTLQPGEGIWMPAGNLHAYLRGTGVEVMAASDNVLRGGLTPKRVDVPELLRVLTFEPLPEPVLRPCAVAEGVTTWPVPVVDFALRRITGPVELDPLGPRTLLCLRGEFKAADADGTVRLGPGEAAFGAATAGRLSVSGQGELYLATVGLSE